MIDSDPDGLGRRREGGGVGPHWSVGHHKAGEAVDGRVVVGSLDTLEKLELKEWSGVDW